MQNKYNTDRDFRIDVALATKCIHDMLQRERRPQHQMYYGTRKGVAVALNFLERRVGSELLNDSCSTGQDSCTSHQHRTHQTAQAALLLRGQT
eukprot:204673-Pyramimonas_sp.AAC.1